MFGLGKRRYGLGFIIAKTRRTNESWIAMVIFVINVMSEVRDHIFSFLLREFGHKQV